MPVIKGFLGGLSLLSVGLSLAGAGCAGKLKGSQQEMPHSESVQTNPPPSRPAHEQGAPIGHRFQNAEEWVPRFEPPDRDGWQRPSHVVDLCDVKPGMTVADLGAGTGYFEPHLSRAVGANGRVIALDAEADMVRYLRERAKREGFHNVEARQVPFEDPKLDPASVDRVVIVDTWHHVVNRGAYSAKLARALRPGGAVCIVDFTLESLHGPPKHMRLTPEQVVEELRAGGLAGEIAKEELTEQYVVLGRK